MAGMVVGNWELEQPIGSGSFATVWRAHHVKTGKMAAVKEINTDKLNRKLQESLASEIAVLQQVQQRNIVGFLDLIKEPGRIYLVLEFCGGGDLGHYLRHYGRVSEDTARYFMLQLVEGLKRLRVHHFIHRDLKPQNLLLSDTTKQPLLKIADFGFARGLEPQGLAETLCGSPLYMAPEILQFHKYDAKADLWSVGTILFELLTGKPPFNGANHLQLLQNIERNEAKLPDPIAAVLSPSCKMLVQQLLRRNPVERISFEEFFDHPWFLPMLGPPEQQQQAVVGAEHGGGGINAAVESGVHAPTAAAAASMQPPVVRLVQPQPYHPQPHHHQRPFQLPTQASLGPAPGPGSLSIASSVLQSPPAAVDSITGISVRELINRSPSPRFVVPLSPNQRTPTPSPLPGSKQISSQADASRPSMCTPTRLAYNLEDSFELDYVVVSPCCSTHVSEVPRQGDTSMRAASEGGSRFHSEPKQARTGGGGAEKHTPNQTAPQQYAQSAGGQSGGHSAGSAPTAAVAAAVAAAAERAHASSMEQVIRLPENVNTLDLLQRVIMVLMQSARARLDALSNATADAGPLGSSTLDASATEAAVAAAGATQAELVGLYLYCCRLLELALLGGTVDKSKAEQAFMLLSSHARSLTSAIEDRLLIQRDLNQAGAEVPGGADMVYDSALRYSRAAAVDELMCHFASSIEQYAKAADLLLFLLVDVPAVAEIKRKLGLADEQRIYKYYAAVKRRQSTCMAAFNACMANEVQRVNFL